MESIRVKEDIENAGFIITVEKVLGTLPTL